MCCTRSSPERTRSSRRTTRTCASTASGRRPSSQAGWWSRALGPVDLSIAGTGSRIRGSGGAGDGRSSRRTITLSRPTASAVRLAVAKPDSPAAQYCLERYFEELAARFETGYDPALGISATPAELTPPRGYLVVATLDEEPVGCRSEEHTSELQSPCNLVCR